MRIQFMFCLDLLYRGSNDDYDYDYDYTPPPSSLVDEIQAQHQLSTTTGILSAPALQIRATRERMDNNTTATGSNEVVERIRCR